MARWLRKMKTDEVFSWNSVLNERPDMIEIGVKEKDQCIARFDAMQKAAAQANARAKTQQDEARAVTPDSAEVELNGMLKKDLLSLAIQRGMEIDSKLKKADIIDLLNA